MKQRLYLRADGAELLPLVEGDGHFAIAALVLPEHGHVQGDVESSYAQMWKLGYLRLVVEPDQVEAECYPAELSPPQHRYLEAQLAAGKRVFFNDKPWQPSVGAA